MPNKSEFNTGIFEILKTIINNPKNTVKHASFKDGNGDLTNPSKYNGIRYTVYSGKSIIFAVSRIYDIDKYSLNIEFNKADIDQDKISEIFFLTEKKLQQQDPKFRTYEQSIKDKKDDLAQRQLHYLKQFTETK
jgi:hypothetical protein